MDQRYLETDFDPKSLKVPELRNLLVQYEIDYPSSAKKADLISLFNEHIKPRAAELLTAHNEVNPSSNGIIDVKSKKDQIEDEEDDDDEDEKVPKRTKSTSPVRRSSRRIASARGKSEEPSQHKSSEIPSLKPNNSDDEDTNDQDTLSLPKRTGRGRSKSPSRKTSGTKKKSGKSAKSEVSSEKEDEIKEEIPQKKIDTPSKPSPFTTRNFFQISPTTTPKKTVPQKRLHDDDDSTTPKSSAKTQRIIHKKTFSSSPAIAAPVINIASAEKLKVEDEEGAEPEKLISPGKRLLAQGLKTKAKGGLFDLDDDEILDKDVTNSEIDEFFQENKKKEKLKIKSKTKSKIAKGEAKEVEKKLMTKKLNKLLDLPQELKPETVKEDSKETSVILEPTKLMAKKEVIIEPSEEEHNLPEPESQPEPQSQPLSISNFSNIPMSQEFAAQLGVKIEGLPIQFPESTSTPVDELIAVNHLPTSENIQIHSSPVFNKEDDDDLVEDLIEDEQINSFADYAKSIGHQSIADQTSSEEEDIDSNEILQQSTPIEEEDDELSDEEEVEEPGEQTIIVADEEEGESGAEIPRINTPELDVSEQDDEELKKLQTDMNKEEKLLEEQSKESLELLNTSRVSIFTILRYICLWFLIVFMGLFAYWYREQRVLIGYCGSETYVPTLNQDMELPVYVFQLGDFVDDTLKPECVPCPSHARCFKNYELGCFDDFVEYKPWYSFGGLIPVSSKCLPDTKKAERLELMIDYSLDLLRYKNANTNCGNGGDFESGLSISELHDLLLEMKAPYITIDEFEELWEKSLVELEKEPEIVIRHKGSSTSDDGLSSSHEGGYYYEGETQDEAFLRSSSLANLSLQCQLQRTIIGSVMKYRAVLLSILSVFIFIRIGIYKYESAQLEKERTNKLYNDIIVKLQKQLNYARNDSTGLTNTYIGSNQLRDLLLSEENSSKKLKIWENVTKKVELNTNIRYHLMEVHGEIMKVWEWITDVE